MFNYTKILIWGSGGHAISVADSILKLNPNIQIIFVDKNTEKKQSLLNFDVITEKKSNKKLPSIVAIGDNYKRKDVWYAYAINNPLIIISPTAHIGKNAIIKKGCFIGNFCHIGPDTIIKENTIINTGAIIEHNTMIGSHCHIAPNATIAGKSKIGDFVFVGASATIINNIRICKHTVIGAGTTVIKSITKPGVYVGSPANKIKEVSR